MSTTPKPRIGRFELHAELGRGFHGRVYLAWDPQLERKIALKLLLGASGDQVNREKFVNEARAAARLAHPNVIPLYDAGVHGKVPYLVFEYVEGVLLRTLLRRRGALPPAEAVALFRQILDGVGAAHSQQIAHLDLSPSNLMIDSQGRVRVMDFGLARFAGCGAEGAKPGEVHGTPRYMSPEHFSGGTLDVQTDVFALGLVLFELLAGQPAVPAGGSKSMREAIVRGKFDWAPITGANVPAELVALVRDAMAVDRATRYRDAPEMQRALDDAVKVQAGPTESDMAVRFLLRRLQRRSEFPAFSNSIIEINRLTAEDSAANLDHLALVIQRDFGLTNRLMKIANSSFFERGSGGVNTVSQAISLVGTRLVRMLCNGLQLFDHLKRGQPALEDSLVSSFVSGLLARHFGLRLRKDLAEEAFICGLFNRLGRNLVIYYLEDEYAEIERLVAGGMPAQQAEQRVLATTYAAMGAAVARSWKFPAALIDSMAPRISGVWKAPETPVAALHAYGHLANELCELASSGTPDALAGLEEITTRYEGVFKGEPLLLLELLGAALEKFRELAPVLGVNVAKNGFLARAGLFRALVTRQSAMAATLRAAATA